MRIKYSQSQKNKLKIAMKSEQKKHKIIQERNDKSLAELQNNLNIKAMRDVRDEFNFDTEYVSEESCDEQTKQIESHEEKNTQKNIKSTQIIKLMNDNTH